MCLQKRLQMHEKTAGEKLQDQGGGFLDIATHIQSSQVDIRISVTTWSTFAAFWIHFHHPYIWQPFDVGRLCVLVCFIDLKMYRNMFYNCLATYAQRIFFQSFKCTCQVEHILHIRICRACQRDIEQALHFNSGSHYSCCQYILRSLKQAGTLSQRPFLIT